jgi:hypothetical protein
MQQDIGAVFENVETLFLKLCVAFLKIELFSKLSPESVGREFWTGLS